MKYLLLLFVLLIAIGSAMCDNKPKKLLIGIKKRNENCTLKTKRGDLLHAHYTGTLENGTVFDNTYHKERPVTFTLGFGHVIKGWDQGLIGMCIGEKRKLVIPPELAFGHTGVPPLIGADQTLIFLVELLTIERTEEV